MHGAHQPPGGVLSAEQWLAADDLADEVADGTLRITTRQDLQFHFVHKGDLRRLIAHAQRAPGHHAGRLRRRRAQRRVLPGPRARPRPGAAVLAAAQALSTRFKPQSAAYYELWVDGEKAVTAEVPEVPDRSRAPLRRRLPAPEVQDRLRLPRRQLHRRLHARTSASCRSSATASAGYVVLVGGGLGQSHAREDDTYPRLASPLAWVVADDLAAAVEAVITIHRDFGNREDRHRARLKYVVDERGLEWFRAEVERRVGHALADPGELPEWLDSADHLGWWQDGRRPTGCSACPCRRAGSRATSAPRCARSWSGGGPRCASPPARTLLLTGFDAADRDAVDAVLRRPRRRRWPTTCASSTATPWRARPCRRAARPSASPSG